jgi:hypothetical protein
VTLTHSADCHDPVCPEPHESQRALPIDVELLGQAIRDHRQAEFDQHVGPWWPDHLCFDDCAEDIAARYDELASR